MLTYAHVTLSRKAAKGLKLARFFVAPLLRMTFGRYGIFQLFIRLFSGSKSGVGPTAATVTG